MSLRANVEPLGWESEFFGIASAKLCFEPTAKSLTSADFIAYHVVQAKVPADAAPVMDALTVLGFRLAEGEIDCSCSVAHVESHAADLLSLPAVNRDDAPRVAGMGDVAALRQLASSAFTLSRFREPWYPEADCRRFYALWAEKAVQGTFDDVCLVIGPVGAIQGMVTLRTSDLDQARIGLLAVQPGLAGRGVGRALFYAAHRWCLENNKTRLRVATQIGNIAALRLYIACGATIDSTAYWFYR
ncbi:dTDP-4-amino-4,6-dideoxy-D-galactose acyltransferase [Acerihabitans sp. TG2]|uniref:dTDP-4-amino-4,6-dideoxy-D-galactose acyltransferase n=1 Tax=Acerihabitans sp. TG2 TaxID=3096008 RepID=UPI002B23D3BD|nr:dTDP-4-amino-4,6-dideoxy-D-galactose acyltransferase [Acerihabitans sp. TG2]MEA9390997.1 dTDP-4-amino-4,6-dideoxy-D-galactose acyltransferase [Acerihabitans sp. TG2]